MPTILVVDDSASDRTLAGGLLRRELDLKVEFAEDGAQALARIQAAKPDVVVTDLLMPEMDGIELVNRVQMAYPEVPVILITGQGSEQLAVDALHLGAISYVPKLHMADTLVETVRQVLELTRAERRFKQLMTCLAETQYRFYLENDPALIAPLVEMLQQITFDMGVCDWSDHGRLGVALDEALLNAIYHGNLELPVQLLPMTRSQIRTGNTADVLEQRASEAPYCDRKVVVEAAINRESARFVIRDDGPGFDLTFIPAPYDPQTFEREHGRGLVLMKSFMDEVTFNVKGNEVTLVKSRSSTRNKGTGTSCSEDSAK